MEVAFDAFKGDTGNFSWCDFLTFVYKSWKKLTDWMLIWFLECQKETHTEMDDYDMIPYMIGETYVCHSDIAVLWCWWIKSVFMHS